MLSRRTALAGLTAMIASPALAQPARPRLPAGARAAVSLTYDDGVDSQLDHAVPVLDALGLKATFFLTQENMEARLADWAKVARDGHEVADHTVSHPCKLQGYSAASFDRREIQPMETFLNSNFGVRRVHTYAYPCGLEGLGAGAAAARRARYLRALKGEVVAARTVEGPPNALAAVERDRFALNGFEPTYDLDEVAPAIRYLRRAMGVGGWAILVFHRVLPHRLEEGDTSVRVHREILSWIAGAPVWCAPMGQVFRQLTA